MTKKEASFILMLAKNRVCDNELNEALDMAVIALNQEPILDKIRAEIEDTGAYEQEVNGKTEFVKGITYCLSIIDKYKAESEELKGEDK